jgi:hypothetical protein
VGYVACIQVVSVVFTQVVCIQVVFIMVDVTAVVAEAGIAAEPVKTT